MSSAEGQEEQDTPPAAGGWVRGGSPEAGRELGAWDMAKAGSQRRKGHPLESHDGARPRRLGGSLWGGVRGSGWEAATHRGGYGCLGRSPLIKVRVHREADTFFGLEHREDVWAGETDLGAAGVEMVPEATGKGEQAQGTALSMGQGKGSQAPQPRSKQRKRGTAGQTEK